MSAGRSGLKSAVLAAQEKPQVHVGEEKVVADRMVKAEDQNLREVDARETVVERRVRANVIRRRTSRVEVPQPEKPDEVEAAKAAVEEAKPVFEEADIAPPAEVGDVSIPAGTEIEPPLEDVYASEPAVQEETAGVEAKAETPPSHPAVESGVTAEAIPEKTAVVEPEASRTAGARGCGRSHARSSSPARQ